MLTISEVVRATQGILLRGNPAATIKNVSIDSRTVKPGNLFIAIRGERFDGHDFIHQAVEKSAGAIVVSEKNTRPKNNIPVICVKDTPKALGQIARFYRDKFSIPVIAVTGSTGKTTAKEMIAAVLKSRYRIIKNIATQNNQIGVPLTLLKLNHTHGAAVVELGTNHFGEMEWLTYIANPTVAVLTNIGESHLEFLKSPAGVFREKSALITHMQKPGYVVFNNDDSYLWKIKAKKIARYLSTFGIESVSDYQADSIELKSNSRLRFRINKKYIFNLKTPAWHNVYNALAAVSCGRLLKISYGQAKKAIGQFRFPKGRQELIKRGPYWIIDDTYNSNPLSFRSAIRTLSILKGQGRKVLLCGDMLELGKNSERLHRSIGELISHSPLDCVVTVGRFSKIISLTIQEKKNRITVSHYDSLNPASRWLKNYLKPKDILLIKGSRRMQMEKALDFLKGA